MQHPLFEVAGVTRAFGGVEVLRGIDFTLQAGEMACLIGPNGCGKTTLFNLITGQVAPGDGKARLDGRSVLGLSPHQIARLRIARKFQVPSVFEDLTVARNLAVARYPFRGALADEVATTRRLLDDTRLRPLADVAAGELSHGQRQWLEIAMALAQQPRLLLLDEPTAGMTAEETRATARLVRSLCAGSAMACLVVEHDMRFVEALEARVLVMLAGRIVADGRFDEIRQLPAVREAYLGKARAAA